MKKLNLLTITAFLALAACGKSGQHPMSESDLKDMRAKGKAEVLTGKEKPQVIQEKIYVDRPYKVTTSESAIDSSALVINPDQEVRLVEGQKGEFKIRAFFTVKDVKAKLVAKNLPEGAELKESGEANTYTVTWTPAIGTVALRDQLKFQKMSVTLLVTEAPNETIRQSLEGLVRDRDFSVVVLHDQAVPSELAIEGLDADVTEGTQVSFTITAKVPGIDQNSAQKPTLEVSYDGGVIDTTKGYLENDGTRHIIAEVNNQEAQYIGNSKWKFTRTFDAKNIGVMPEQSLRGEMIPNAEASHVRFAVRVFSPFNTATPKLLKQLRIVHPKQDLGPEFDATPAAPAKTAPVQEPKAEAQAPAAPAADAAPVAKETPKAKEAPKAKETPKAAAQKTTEKKADKKSAKKAPAKKTAEKKTAKQAPAAKNVQAQEAPKAEAVKEETQQSLTTTLFGTEPQEENK